MEQTNTTTTTISTKFVFFKETPGALHYKELDAEGAQFPYPNSPGAKVGAIYIRKTATNGQPQKRSS